MVYSLDVILSQFWTIVPCLVLTVAFWPAYKFLRRQVKQSGIPMSLKFFHILLGFLGGSDTVKNLPAIKEIWVWSLDREDSLRKEMAIYSSILAWRVSIHFLFSGIFLKFEHSVKNLGWDTWHLQTVKGTRDWHSMEERALLRDKACLFMLTSLLHVFSQRMYVSFLQLSHRDLTTKMNIFTSLKNLYAFKLFSSVHMGNNFSYKSRNRELGNKTGALLSLSY